MGRVAALPPEAVVGIIAGGGGLPAALRSHLLAAGAQCRVVALAGEATLEDTDSTRAIADVEGIFSDFETFGVTHAVLVGWVRRRPTLSEARIGRRALRSVPRLLRALGRGDDAMLSAVVRALEGRGMVVLGVHELWPEIVATGGTLGHVEPGLEDDKSVELGLRAARALGALDAGQGVVVVGRRIVALEGLEGTAEMLERVAHLRATGRLKGKTPRGVLVKAAKPGQERRADLPAIGSDTIAQVEAAGLRGIAVEAGSSLIIERERLIEAANVAGVFVHAFEGAAA